MYQSDEYVRSNDGPLPVKWMAPESIVDRIFTTKSDVWSYGILLWEIFSLGSTPYPGLEVNEEFIQGVVDGDRIMTRPKYCPGELYDSVILNCWLLNPGDRLDFAKISEQIRNFVDLNFMEYYIVLEDKYIAMNDHIYQHIE